MMELHGIPFGTTDWRPAWPSLLLVCGAAMVANTLGACAQAPQPPHPGPSFDPAVVREQKRRIAAYDAPRWLREWYVPPLPAPPPSPADTTTTGP